MRGNRHTKYHEEMLKCPKVAMAPRRPRQSNRMARRNYVGLLVL
jgi:hypothetical protein